MTQHSGSLQPVPRVDADELAAWLYQSKGQIQVSGPAYQTVALPQPQVMVELLQAAADEGGSSWVLVDGPRPQRPFWLIDPWWSEEPEMSQVLIERTQSRCLPLQQLQQALISLG